MFRTKRNSVEKYIATDSVEYCYHPMTARTDTPQRLLAEAVRVIDAHGEASIRIRDVASACGVTSPIVYKAFGSREGLIVAAQAERYIRSWRETSTGIPESFSNSNTVDELKQALGTVITSVLGSDRRAHRRRRHEVLGSLAHIPELENAVAAALSSVRHGYVQALTVAREKGLVRQDVDLDAAVMWYFGQIDGRYLIEIGDQNINETAWNKIFLEGIFASLFVDPTAPTNFLSTGL